jgi:hypothetical protein
MITDGTNDYYVYYIGEMTFWRKELVDTVFQSLNDYGVWEIRASEPIPSIAIPIKKELLNKVRTTRVWEHFPNIKRGNSVHQDLVL